MYVKRQKVKGYLIMNGISLKDIAKLAGVAYKTASGVLCGHGKSDKVRRAAIELLRFKNPVAADKVEKIWPKGAQLKA